MILRNFLICLVGTLFVTSLCGKDSYPTIDTNLKLIEYEIKADSFDEAIKQCYKLGKNGWPGYTEWELVWRYNFSDFKFTTETLGDKQTIHVNNIKVDVTRVSVIQKVYLPRLVSSKKFTSQDKKKWNAWFKRLEGHEQFHQRISSTKEIETWLKRRVGNIRSLEGTIAANKEATADDARVVIKSALTKVYQHASTRIRDKNIELDQLTNHRYIKMDWKKFLIGYF